MGSCWRAPPTHLNMTLFFDIETGPRSSAILDLLERDPWPDPVAPDPFDADSVLTGNIRDPEKINAKILAAQEKHAAAVQKALKDHLEGGLKRERSTWERAPLDPALAEILSIQYAIGRRGEVEVLTGSEADILNEFFAVAQKRQIWINWTGSNGSGNFDLNHIYRRASAMRVERTVDHFDALHRSENLAKKMLLFSGWNSFLGLEKAARELGCPILECPLTGKDFHSWFKGEAEGSEFDPEEQKRWADRYSRQDIILMQMIDSCLDNNSDDFESAIKSHSRL